MKYSHRSTIFLLLLIFASRMTAQFQEFVTAQGDKLMEGTKELRFVSYNIPNLHYIEDNHQFTERSPWRAADEFEIRDALSAIRQAGAKVTRMYVISVRKENESPEIIRHVEGAGKFNGETPPLLPVPDPPAMLASTAAGSS